MSNKFADLGFEPVETVDSFEPAFRRTLAFEGGNTVDHAGPTNLGVTQDTYNNWRKRQGLPTKSVRDIDESEAKELYRKEYFEKPGFSKLPANVAGVLFDFGVNAGTPRAAMALQKAVGASPDGVIGPKTLKAVDDFVNRKGEQPLLQSIIDQRSSHVDSLIQKNPAKYKKFEKGWKNRINAIKAEFKLSDLNPFSVSEANASELPGNDFADLGFEEAAPAVQPAETFDDLGFEPQENPTPMIEKLAKGFGQGVAGSVKGLGGGLELLGDQVPKELAPIFKIATQFGGKQLSNLGESREEFYKVPDPDLAYNIASGVGSMGTFLIPGLGAAKAVQAANLAPKIASAVGATVSGAMEAMVESGATYQRAKDKGFDDKGAIAAGNAAFALNVPTTILLNKIGVFGDVADEITTGLKRVIATGKPIGMASLSEGAQEALQQVISNTAVSDDPSQGVFESALIGAIVGGGVKSIHVASDALSKDAAPTVSLEKDTVNGKVLDEKDVPAQAPAPSKEILAEAKKPATPVERASKHGEVVGIDAKSGLPVIDTSVKPQVQSEAYTGPERRDSDLIPPPTTPKHRLSDWTPLLNAFDDAGKKAQIAKLPVSDTIKGKLLDHYGLLFDKTNIPADVRTPTPNKGIVPKEDVSAPAGENTFTGGPEGKLSAIGNDKKDITDKLFFDVRKQTQSDIDDVVNKLANNEPIDVYRATDKDNISIGRRVTPFKGVAEEYGFKGSIKKITVLPKDLKIEEDSGHLIYVPQEAQSGKKEDVLIPSDVSTLSAATDTADAGKAPVSPLHAEALKYKTAEEFVKSVNKNVYRKSLGEINNSYFEFPSLEKHPAGENLPETVTAYRGIKSDLPIDKKIGEFFSLSKEDAKRYGNNIQTITAPKSDFRVNPYTPGIDLVYLPKGTKSTGKNIFDSDINAQLAAIYNEAHGQIEKQSDVSSGIKPGQVKQPAGDPASLKPPTVSQKEAGSTLEKVEQEIISSAIDPTKAPEKRLSAGMSIQEIPKGKTKLSPSLKVDVNDKLNGDFKFSDPETELRYKNAQGVFSGNKIKTRIHEMFSEFAKRATRTYPELENDPKYSSFKVLLDKHRIGKQVAQDRAIRIIDGITAGFGPVKKDIFTRKVLLDDLINEAKSGRAVPFGYSNYDESGNLVINNEALNKDYSNINKVVENNPDIKAAVEKRNKIQNAIAQELVDAGILSEEQLKNNYYRHQVLEYANIKASFGGGKTLKTPKPGYAKGRKGSTYDINTNYVEAEFEFMAQALNDIETVKTIQQIEKSPLNISKKVRADFNAAKESDPNVKQEDFIPEGYSVWQPVKGNVFYTAYSVPERVISQMMTDQGVGGLSANDVHKILAIGGKKKQLILPDGVVKTLDNLYEVKNDNVIVKGATFLTNKWKGYILVNPRRFFKYNLQNFIGDFDAVIAGDPRILKKMGEANSELVDVFYNGKEMSPDLREYFERGGISSQLTVSELPELNELEIFKRLSSQQFSAKNLNIWEKYWESVGKFTTYREAILRYAAYKHYKELYSKGTPKTFGASRKEDILALNDPKDQAAKVATELLGDYANITAFGKDMRQTLAPFWSWYEVNLKRYARLTRNAFDEGFEKGIKTSATIAGLKGSAFLVKWLLRAMLMTGAVSLYNHLFHSDVEDDLGQYDRNRMHITIGKTKDGQNVIFRTQGAFADVLEWLGLDGAPTLTKQYFDGKASLGDIFGTIPYTDIPAMGLNPLDGEIGLHAAANKVLRAIGPLYKVPTETLTGYSWGGFDDKAHKVEDKKRNIARLVSLENEYDAIVGNPTRGYFRSLAEAFVAISDPEENAYRYIQSLKYQYKEAVLGQGGSGDYYSPRSILYRKYKKALRFKDEKVADKVFAQMKELGVKEEDLKQSLNASDPLFGLNKDNKKHFTETYLSDADREKLRRANAYYEKTFKQTMSKQDKENELKIKKWLQSK